MAKFRLLVVCIVLLDLVSAEDDSLRDRYKLLGQMTKFGLYGLGLVLLAMSPLRHQPQASLASFWLLWSFVQQARWLPTIDLKYPTYYSDFYEYVAQTMCVLRLSEPKGMDIDQKTFTHFCAVRNLFVVNGVDMLLVLLIAIGVLIIAMVAGADADEGLRLSFKQQAQYSALIRGVSMTSFDLVIYAVLQLQFYDMDDNFQRFSTIMAILYLACIAVYTVALPVMIVKNREKIRRAAPPAFCATLTEECRSDMPHLAYHYETLLHAQRLCSSLVLTLLYTSPTVQLGLLCGLESGVLAWMIWARPFPRVLLLICSVSVHALMITLIALQWMFETSFLSEGVLTLASVFVFWSGILVCVVRYFANFKLPQKSAPVVHLETTNDTTDNSSILTSTPVAKSQHPNEPYHPTRVPRLAFLRPVD